MTTSGSVDFTQNLTGIITDAYHMIGVGAEGEAITDDNYQRAKRSLNRMIKSWETQGVHLWKYRTANLFLSVGKENYLLGKTGDNATDSFVKTTTTIAAILGDGTITVDDDTGILNGDFIGIVLDSGDIQWTTINGVPAANVITLTDVLTDTVAIGNVIYVYTTKINRPLLLDNVNIKINNYNEVPMILLERQEYFNLPTKSSQGTPTQYHYNPTLTNGILYIWTTASTSNNYIKFSYIPDFEDLDTALNTSDFPIEWLDCIVYNLALRLGIENGLSASATFAQVQSTAIELLRQAKGFDNEQGFVSFEPYGNNHIEVNS